MASRRARHRILGLTLLNLLLLLAPLAPASAAPASVALPDTPAGMLFADWLLAFNTGKRETIRQFIAAHFEKPPTGPLQVDSITDLDMRLYVDSQGLDVRKIGVSSPETITAIVQARRTGCWMQVLIYASAQAPYEIEGFGFRNTEAPAELLSRRRLTESEIRGKIDSLIGMLTAASQFSGAILVARNGRPFYERACGLASRAWNAPNTIDTRFNLASMNKMFTAVAIAQLAEQGKISYEDPIGKFLPDYPNKDAAEKVTIRHLLTHTAGLAGSRESMRRTASRRRTTVADDLATFWNDPLHFQPGAKFDYSNDGYIVLGAIIEKASGQDYYDYIREHIYRPAGITDSDSYELDTDPPHLATGYGDGPDGSRRSNIFQLGVRGGPAGGGYSTVEDLLKFDTALRNHTLLRAESLDTIWTGRVDYPGHDSQYGYGFAVKRYNGTRIVGHSGGWVGVTDQMDIYPDLGYTVVILTNIDDAPESIAMKLREWLTQGRA